MIFKSVEYELQYSNGSLFIFHKHKILWFSGPLTVTKHIPTNSNKKSKAHFAAAISCLTPHFFSLLPSITGFHHHLNDIFLSFSWVFAMGNSSALDLLVSFDDYSTVLLLKWWIELVQVASQLIRCVRVWDGVLQ